MSASNNSGGKQYGLIIPKKQQPGAPKVSNIFADDNGSDEEDGYDWVQKAIKAEGEKNKIKKQTKLNMQKALKEDPTIFQYDEVYDDIERTKSQSKIVKEEKKKPKYIENLLKAAERRKKEQEHRIERMVQKEREAEGTMFADKESFVTSAYRAKLEEFKKMEEEESRMDRLEAIGDVKKQQDMSGFYRHLYEQTVECTNTSQNVKDEKIDKADDTKEDNVVDNAQSTPTTSTSKEQITNAKKRSRQYRQRKVEDESDSEAEVHQEAEAENKVPSLTDDKNVNNPDTDEPDNKKQKQQSENSTMEDKENTKVTENNTSNIKNSENVVKDSEDNIKPNKTDITVTEKTETEKKEKLKIWEKRCVGPVFEAALQRYYARKAMRQSAT